MSDLDRSAMEAEAPVNPYSLLEAVNSSSDTTHMSWLIFIGVMSYILIAVAGVSHLDLLLNNEISLPVVQVNIELKQFFLFAPIVLVVIHLGAIMQLVMLAHKAIEFDRAMRLLEVSDRRAHPLRLELHNFFFVQGIAGPMRSRVMGLLLHLMTWLTLVIMPVLLLLFIQTSFIPYHSIPITWTHRIVLLTDIVLLITIGVFLVRSEPSFFRAIWRSAMQNPFSFLSSTVVLLYVTFFSFFVVTIPGEPIALFAEKHKLINDNVAADGQSDYQLGFAIPSFGRDRGTAIFWRFRRNLVVTGADIVKDKDVSPGEPTVDLRDRDLRYAVLDRTDLRQADLTRALLMKASLKGTILRDADLRQARLQNAVLIGADLRGVTMHCRNIDALNLGEGWASAQCTEARNADFAKAKLSKANLLGMDLTGANFVGATMSDINLRSALMSGVNFSYAHLERADLTEGVALQGSNFELASLQGANLLSANLQGANLGNVFAQGAILRWAILDGAILSEANLQGADLTQASLFGANMGNAKLTGADLRGATIWATAPPSQGHLKLADMSGIVLAAPGPEDREIMLLQLQSVPDKSVRLRVRRSLRQVTDAKASDLWAASDARRSWDALIVPPGTADNLASGADLIAAPGTNYKGEVTAYLAKLMCNNPWKPGAVATGIVQQASHRDRFRGDGAVLHQELKNGRCAGAKGVSSETVGELSTSLAGAGLQ